jgi:hypothetical protein
MRNLVIPGLINGPGTQHLEENWHEHQDSNPRRTVLETGMFPLHHARNWY